MGRTLRILVVLAVLGVGSLAVDATPAKGTGFIVDIAVDDADAHDANPGDCICADTWGSCTLRAAIEEANQCPGVDTITFQSEFNIYISQGVLPSLDETTIIDASSVWNTVDDTPGVMINGQGGSFSGLYLGAGSCQIYGLYITNFGGDGLLVVSAANWIGGTGAGQRNVLSGNDTGISLYTSAAQNNVLHNNYLGLTPAGNTKNPNGTGLYIGNGAVDNIIGGNDAAHANFISGNTYEGASIEGTGTDNNWLGGNGIGLAADLSTNLGNGTYGIRIRNWAANTVIGGASGSGNIVSYNTVSGIYLENASGTQITDNLIGSNSGDGIFVNSSTACVIGNNLITGNSQNGVRVAGASAAGNLIWPNSIWSNGGKGIQLQDGGNMGIAAPVISSASQWGASGTTCASCRVALYSDASDEGQVYHDILWADAGGNWSYVGGPLTGPNLTATSIDGSGNTSEFSGPYAISSLQHRTFLPLVYRNH